LFLDIKNIFWGKSGVDMSIWISHPLNILTIGPRISIVTISRISRKQNKKYGVFEKKKGDNFNSSLCTGTDVGNNKYKIQDNIANF